MKVEMILEISEALKKAGSSSGKFLSARKHKIDNCIVVTLRTKEKMYYYPTIKEIKAIPYFYGIPHSCTKSRPD